MKKWLFIGLLTLSLTAYAGIDVYEFDSPAQEAQFKALIADFRCPTCQNQNLAGSDAPIAKDLKQKTYEMVKDGKSDSEIREYMFKRYGDFISYKPPVRPSTWILWFFPPILLLVVLAIWAIKHRNKNQLSQKPLTNNQSSQPSTSDHKPLTADEEQRLADILNAYQKDKEQ